MKTVFQFIMPTVQDINMMKCTMANPTVGWGDTFIAHWTFTLAYQKSRDTLVAIHAPRHTRTKHSKSNWLFNHTVATSVADKLKRQWLWAANCLRQCFSVTSCAHGGSWGSYSDFYSRHYCSGSTYSLAHAAYRLAMLLLQDMNLVFVQWREIRVLGGGELYMLNNAVFFFLVQRKCCPEHDG